MGRALLLLNVMGPGKTGFPPVLRSPDISLAHQILHIEFNKVPVKPGQA